MDKALIAVNGVTVRYAGGSESVLQDVTLRLQPSRICGLLGMNGAGKSTLFKVIMGFIKPDFGSVMMDGLPVGKALKAGLVSYVPQADAIDWDFPVLVEDVVMMGRYGKMGMLRHPAAADHRAVDEALERTGMSDLRKRQIGQLSGGQKKRVFVARALAQGGEITLMDEPFAGVDAQTEDSLISLLRDLATQEGRLILIATHNLGSVPEFCNEAILLNRSIIAHGTVKEVFTQENLEQTFGGALRHMRWSAV